MRKTFFMLLSVTLLCAYSQPLTSAKDVEVTNYTEVISQIEYPRDSKEKGIEGTVIVSLEIDHQGNLVGHEFISYPCNALAGVVKESLAKLQFSPATNDAGNAITSRITMPVKFELSI